MDTAFHTFMNGDTCRNTVGSKESLYLCGYILQIITLSMMRRAQTNQTVGRCLLELCKICRVDFIIGPCHSQIGHSAMTVARSVLVQKYHVVESMHGLHPCHHGHCLHVN